jgi:hypothetical protein
MKGSASVVLIFDFDNNNRFPILQIFQNQTTAGSGLNQNKKTAGFHERNRIFWVVI